MTKVPKRTAARDSTLAIVERELELKSDTGESKVIARIRRPVPDGETTFRCEVEIEGLGEPISTYGVGVDGIQPYGPLTHRVSQKYESPDAFKQHASGR